MSFSTSFEVKIDKGAVDQLLRSPSGPVGQEIGRRGQLVESAARAGAPVDSGALTGSVSMNVKSDANGVVAEISVGTSYWKYQEFGTRHMSANSFLRPALQAAAG